MCGSGLPTGTTISTMRRVRRAIQTVRQAGMILFCAEVVGATTPGIGAFRFASGSTGAPKMTSWASAAQGINCMPVKRRPDSWRYRGPGWCQHLFAARLRAGVRGVPHGHNEFLEGCKVDCVNGHRIEQTRRTDGNRTDRHETDRHTSDGLQEPGRHHWQEWASQAADEGPLGAGDERRTDRARGL